MQNALFDQRWPALLAALPADFNLDETARASGALRRRRAIGDAAALLRLALGYGPGGLSLRGAAAWAELAGVASLSDVAVLKRLRGAGDWLSHIAGALLAARVAVDRTAPPHRLRLIDATTICAPSFQRIMWRLHVGYDPIRPGFDDLQLTDQSSGEHLERFAIHPGDLVIADCGLARGRGVRHVIAQGGDFIVRSGWRTQKLWQPDSGERFDVLGALTALTPGAIADIDVVVDKRRKAPPLVVRFIAVKKSDAAAQHSRKRVRRRSSDKQRTPDPRSFIAADYFFVLTSLPHDSYPPERVLALYRVRWQVELAFKRLKSLLHLSRLPAKDAALARSWIYAHLIAALLIDDLAQDFLDSPPCAQRHATAVPLARLQGAGRRGGRGHPRRPRAGEPARARRLSRPPHLRSASKTTATNAHPRPGDRTLS